MVLVLYSAQNYRDTGSIAPFFVKNQTSLNWTEHILSVSHLEDETHMFRGQSEPTFLNESSVNTPKIVLVSYMFGADVVQKRYLRLFVESARLSGVDVLLLGDHKVLFF